MRLGHMGRVYRGSPLVDYAVEHRKGAGLCVTGDRTSTRNMGGIRVYRIVGVEPSRIFMVWVDTIRVLIVSGRP